MRHIALVTTSYPDGTSGMEAAGSFVADFAEQLSRRVRVTVVAAGRHDHTAVEGSLTVRRFAVPSLPLSLLSPANPLHWRALISTIRAGSKAVDDLAANDAPDHIMALWILPSGYWARSAAKRHGFGYSVWALGSDIWSLGRIPLVRKILKNVANAATQRFADGVELGSAVESLTGNDCGFLPSTRRLPKLAKDAQTVAPPYKLAFLGRWHPNKGADLLLEALEKLDDSDWEKISELRIFGGGPLEEVVKQKSRALQSKGRPVEVGGYLDKAGAAKFISRADYLLLPSRIESIPVIFSDAMQLSTPIIATPVGDLPQLHEKYDFGVIAKAIEADAFADAIVAALLTGPARYAEGTAQAGEDFDLEKIVDHFLQQTGMQAT